MNIDHRSKLSYECTEELQGVQRPMKLKGKALHNVLLMPALSKRTEIKIPTLEKKLSNGKSSHHLYNVNGKKAVANSIAAEKFSLWSNQLQL